MPDEHGRIGANPPLFRMCGKQRTLSPMILDVWQRKGLRANLSDVWQLKELIRKNPHFLHSRGAGKPATPGTLGTQCERFPTGSESRVRAGAWQTRERIACQYG